MTTEPLPAGPPRPSPAPDPPARPAPVEGRVADLVERLARLRTDPRAGAALLLVVALAAGTFWFRAAGARPRTSSRPVPTTVVRVAPTTTSPPTTTATVVVHVAGAVRRPGVVSLRAGARVVDAVQAAGGAADGADLDRLNLAAKLVDGERIAVAHVGDPLRPAPASPPAPAADGGDAEAAIDLNTATADELEALPGIGPTLAAAIVEERDRRGGFTDVGQLRQVSGIGERRFAQVRDRVRV